MKYALAGVTALAALALIIGVVALGRGPEKDETGESAPGGDPAALRAELDALEAEVAELAAAREKLIARAGELETGIRELTGRLEELAERPATDPAADQVRRRLLERGERLPVLPEALPAAVKQAAERLIPGLELTRLDERIRDGRHQYRLEGRLPGADREYELEILPNGEILEADLPPEAAPANLREIAARTLGGLEIARAQVDRDDGQIVYDFEGEEAGEEYQIRLAGDGRVLEAELPPRAVPGNLREIVDRALGGLEIDRAELYTDEGRTLYRLEAREGRAEYSVRLAADGELLRVELPPRLVPAELRAVARGAVDGFEIEEIEREPEDGELVYEFKGRAGRARCRVKVNDAGQVVRANFSSDRLPAAIREAAEKAAPGLRLDREARQRRRDGELVYELDGRVGRREVELRLAPDGEVLQVRGLEEEGDEEPGAAATPPPAPGAGAGDGEAL